MAFVLVAAVVYIRCFDQAFFEQFLVLYAVSCPENGIKTSFWNGFSAAFTNSKCFQFYTGHCVVDFGKQFDLFIHQAEGIFQLKVVAAGVSHVERHVGQVASLFFERFLFHLIDVTEDFGPFLEQKLLVLLQVRSLEMRFLGLFGLCGLFVSGLFLCHCCLSPFFPAGIVRRLYT